MGDMNGTSTSPGLGVDFEQSDSAGVVEGPHDLPT